MNVSAPNSLKFLDRYNPDYLALELELQTSLTEPTPSKYPRLSSRSQDVPRGVHAYVQRRRDAKAWTLACSLRGLNPRLSNIFKHRCAPSIAAKRAHPMHDASQRGESAPSYPRTLSDYPPKTRTPLRVEVIQ